MALPDWLSSIGKARAELNPQYQAIKAKILSDPYYRLRSPAEVQIAASLGVRIDVNQASVDDWLRLPGLSIHQARSLVRLTEAGAQFYCIEDIAAALNSPVQRLQLLEPVLTFYYYDATDQPIRVNPNTADATELAQVPGLDDFLARAIYNNRLSYGPYRTLEDLQKRLYLPKELVQQLVPHLRF